jgi:hypothetical protein
MKAIQVAGFWSIGLLLAACTGAPGPNAGAASEGDATDPTADAGDVADGPDRGAPGLEAASVDMPCQDPYAPGPCFGPMPGPAGSNPVYDDIYQGFTYVGPWQAVSGVMGAVNNTLHWSNSPGAETRMICPAGGSGAYGVAFDLIFSRAYNRGIATVWVTHPSHPDVPLGVQHIDMFGSGVLRQARYEYSTGDLILSTGSPYVIHITVSGDKNLSSSDYFVDVDAIECDLG